MTFPRSYECQELVETPQPAIHTHFYYPGATLKGGRDGMLVEILPYPGKPWLATFEFGIVSPKSASGVWATPDSQRVCVVARGAGYIVSTTDPTSWELVQATPIMDVRCVPAQNVIVFATFTDLVAYGKAGIRWRTKRLSWDGLQILELSDKLIRGEFWDIRSETVATFVVDLETGAHEGGIEGLE